MVCGHGSTAAEIDEDLLFYLRARGIPWAQARAMLIESLRRRGARARSRTKRCARRLAHAAAGWLGVKVE